MSVNKKNCFMIYVLLILAFTISGAILGQEYIQCDKEINNLKQLQQITQSTISLDVTAADIFSLESMEAPTKTILKNYEVLSARNKDMIGWLKIEGTNIDYPVMYTGDDFYLTHDFDHAISKSGLPYIDRRCAVEPFGTNTIIYAHNMKNGTMFSVLLNFKEPDYYTNHRIICFDTLYETQEYEIFAAFESEVYKKGETIFKHYNFLNAESEAVFYEYIAGIRKIALYETGVSPRFGDEFITLMTCSYHTENGRFAVVARKMVP